MDYLQYLKKVGVAAAVFYVVLNLIINGLPSILEDNFTSKEDK